MKSRLIPVDADVALHVASCGAGPDVLVLSGGPGCVHYLKDEELAPVGFRTWFPDPRGVGRSGGGPHDMGQAVADLETVRRALDIDTWLVVGHSWGSDLAVRYALEHPDRVRGVIGIAGHGLHRDREWSEAYEAGKATEPPVPIDLVPDVHASLWTSFREWIHQPTLWRDLADTAIPMDFIAAGDDIRPDWPLRQLAALVPGGTFQVVRDAVHDFWSTDPPLWRHVVTTACRKYV